MERLGIRRIVSFAPSLVVLVTAALLLYGLPRLLVRAQAARTQATISLAQQRLDRDDFLDRLNNASRDVSQAVTASLVHISIPSLEGPGLGGSASGSGWVYDTAGHIVTNAHVVRGEGGQIDVQFSDGRVEQASVVGADPFTDVAVLRVPAGPWLFPARRGDRLGPAQGDRVFAFGSPFGFRFSMSQGIVSGLGRTAAGASELGASSNFIQTDAAVNPGNSGGPLVDVRGRVIGMNTAIATAWAWQGTVGEGQSAGIGFAIPLATVEFVADQLIATGKVSRGFLGISFGSEVAPQEGGDGACGAGVVVESLSHDGPAQRAGLIAGDVVTHVESRGVEGVELIRALVSSRAPRTTITIRVCREGRALDLPVELGEMPLSALVPPTRFLALQTGLFLSDTDAGPVVTGVLPGSAAAGVIPAQKIITRVNGTAVRTQEDVVLRLIEDGWLMGRKATFTLTDSGVSEPREVELTNRRR